MILQIPLMLFMALAQSPTPLIWAGDEEGGAPYMFLDSKLGRVGFELDIINALEEELKRPIEFKQYSFDSLIPGLIKGDFDFAMNGIEITEERQQSVLFSKPYYIYRQQLVIRADEKRFTTLLGCKNTQNTIVGTMDGTQSEKLLKQANIPVRTYQSPTEAYADLISGGRIDAVFLDLPIAISYALPDKRLLLSGQPTARGLYAIAVKPNNQALVNQINSALDSIKANGKLRSILVKWNLWDAYQEEISPGFFFEEEGKPDSASITVFEENKAWTIARYLPLLLEGTLVTVELTLSSFSLALLLGLPLSLARLYGTPWLKSLALLYIEFFRGVPVLLLLFFIYFGLPAIAESSGLNISLALSPFFSATLGLGLNYAAYEAETFRAAIQSVPQGQWEAAASLGMDKTLTFRRIILPQALRIALPTTTNDLVALFKDTSIASAVALVELNKQYQILAKSSLKFVEIGLITAVLYLALSVPLGRLARTLEKKLAPEKR